MEQFANIPRGQNLGGPGAASTILGAIARGRTQRRQEQREAQRQAILNRLSESQLERTEQATRIAAEQEQRQQEQFEQMMQGREALANIMKQRFLDQGMEVAPAENLTVNQLTALDRMLDRQARRELDRLRTEANVSALQAETRARRTRQELEQDVFSLLGDENFFEVAQALLEDGGISEATSSQAIENTAKQIGVDNDAAISTALRAMSGDFILTPGGRSTGVPFEESRAGAFIARDRARGQGDGEGSALTPDQAAERFVSDVGGGDPDSALTIIQDRIDRLEDKDELTRDERNTLRKLKLILPRVEAMSSGAAQDEGEEEEVSQTTETPDRGPLASSGPARSLLQSVLG